jgi:hypothetical protein
MPGFANFWPSYLISFAKTAFIIAKPLL